MMHVYSRRLTCSSYPQKQQQQLYLVLMHYLQIRRTRKECSVCIYRLQKYLETVKNAGPSSVFSTGKSRFGLNTKRNRIITDSQLRCVHLAKQGIWSANSLAVWQLFFEHASRRWGLLNVIIHLWRRCLQFFTRFLQHCSNNSVNLIFVTKLCLSRVRLNPCTKAFPKDAYNFFNCLAHFFVSPAIQNWIDTRVC